MRLADRYRRAGRKFGAVDKGSQANLSDFGYGSPPVVVASSALPLTLAVTEPDVYDNAEVTYSHFPADGSICTVDFDNGTLTLVGLGECEVTATATETANYGSATAVVGVEVQAGVTTPSVGYENPPISMQVGVPVTITVSDTDDPDTGFASHEYSLPSGSELPAGLTLNMADGSVGGTPTAVATATTVTVRVQDVNGVHQPGGAKLVLPAVDQPGLSQEESMDAAEQALEEFGQAVSAQSAAIVGERLFSSQALPAPSIEAPSSSLRLRLAGREFDLAEMGESGGLDESDRSWMDLEELTGDSDDWADSAFELSSARAGGRFQSVWGRGALTKFESGGAEDEGKLDGKVVSGYLGAEFGTPDRLAGVALSRSSGDGDYETLEDDGGTVRKAKVDLDLTAVHPYARWRLDRKLSVWGALGLGRGEMSIKQGDVESRSDLELQSLAAGVVDEMEPRGDIELAVKGDFTYTRLESKDRTADDAADLSGRYGTKRFRVALAAAMERKLPGAATLRPSLELAGRIDDGDSQEGLGASLSAGLGREADMESLYENCLARIADAEEEGDEDDEESEDASSFRYTMDLGYGLAIRRWGLLRPYASLTASSGSGVLGSGFELKLPGYGDATFGVRGERDLDDGDGLVEFTIGTEF